MSIFRKPESLFIKAKVRDILFDGLLIDCNVTDIPGSGVCKEIKEHYDDFHLKRLSEDLFSMSFFGWVRIANLKKKKNISN